MSEPGVANAPSSNLDDDTPTLRVARRAPNGAQTAATTTPAAGAMNRPAQRSRRPRVVVVGAGFAGVNVIRALGGGPVNLLVVDQNNYNGFWPLLYQVAIAGLEPGAIGQPGRTLARSHRNVRFQQAEARGVDLARGQLLTDGAPIPYDYLILAAGSANNYFGNDTLAQHTFGLKDIYDAVRLRDQVLGSFEQAARTSDPAQRRELLTFVIVGGGPTGVELAGMLAEFVDHTLPRDYPTIHKDEIQIIIAQGHGDVLPGFAPSLRAAAERRLTSTGVTVKTGHHVSDVRDGVVTFDDHSTLRAGTVVWAAGVKAADFAETLPVKLAHKGRVPVTPTLNLANHPEVFVVGDMAYLEGYKGNEAYPMLAPVAIQQGRLAAQNILAHINGEPLKPFHYLDKGTMATVGWNYAVMDAFDFKLSGWPAWVAWLLVHQLYLVGFRTRLLTLFTWLYNAFTLHQSVQLVGLDESASSQPDELREGVAK